MYQLDSESTELDELGFKALLHHIEQFLCGTKNYLNEWVLKWHLNDCDFNSL